MAASQADLSRLDAILKDRPLQDQIRKALNRSTPFAEKITQQLTLSGRKGIFPVQFGVNEGIYARAEKGTFGDSQVDSPSLAEVTAKYIYALFEITGQIISASRDNPGAFEEGMALTMENTIDGLKLDMSRQVIGDGTGKVCLVQSKTDTNTYVLDSPFGLTRYKTATRPVRNILRKNMAIDVLDASTPTTKYVDNSALSAVTHATTGTTVDFAPVEATTGVADGDWVTRAGNYNLEMEGFLKAVDTAGSYLNITRSGNDGWQGQLVDAAGGAGAGVALDPDHLRDTVDSIMEASGEAPEFLVMNYKQRRNLYNLVAPQIRYAPMMAPQGLREDALAFDDMPVLVERFFPPEHIGIANLRFWYHAIDKDAEWIRGIDGTVLHFGAGTQDLFKAVLRTYRNLACLYPAAQGLIYGLTE
jgi:hypothetical protein